MQFTNLLRALPLLAALLALPATAFDLQGHRGARGLAPENTLAAFQRALEIGVDTLELDIGVTADGVVVISHDPYLNPAITRDFSGQWLPGTRGPLIRALTLAQLQNYKLGRSNPASRYGAALPDQRASADQPMPTLAALFDFVKARGAGKVRFNIETKLDPTHPDDTVSAEAMTTALLAVIRAANMAERVTLQSFDWRSLQLGQKLAPEIPTVYLTVETPNYNQVVDARWTAGLQLADYGNSVPKMVKAAGGAVWSPNGGAVTEALVKEAQALGLKVIPWTINTAAEMQRLIGWGVDGIITDYPDRLRAVMGERGMPLPGGLIN